MRRRLEKIDLGFSHVFSANLSNVLSNIYIGNFLYVYTTNKWPKKPKTLTQNIQKISYISYIRQIIAQISQNMQRKTYRKFSV